MTTLLFSVLIILHLVSCTTLTNCNRKNPRKDQKAALPTYEIHKDNKLPHDVQISTFLARGEVKRFFYESPVDSGDLSVTIIVCSSPVRWIFTRNQTVGTSSSYILTNSMDTHHVSQVTRGDYVLEILATDFDSLVHVYVSTESGGPQALQNSEFQKLRLLKRQRRKRLTVKWNPSLVDPQGTTYCLVVSLTKHYKTLCSTQISTGDPLIVCVGRRTHHTLSNLRQGQIYYLDLFATNHQSNLTYLFATETTTFDDSFKPINLKDSKATFANLKKLDGKAVFRYKIPLKSTSKTLDLFIVPCGGAVDVEVSLKDATVIPPQRIEGFGKISVTDPLQGVRYYIKVFSMNREELKRTTGVEVIVYATTKNNSKIPLPNMPQEIKLEEYKGLKTCDSVTVGYIAAPVQKITRYCLVVKEGRMIESDDYRLQNQCGLEGRLKKSAQDFDAKYCKDVKYDKEQVIIQKVPRLKPGRHYIVQVTVKKPRGKTLSYDLLEVFTKKSCHDRKKAISNE